MEEARITEAPPAVGKTQTGEEREERSAARENIAEGSGAGPESPRSEAEQPDEADDDMDIVAFLQANIGEIELPTPIETMEMLDEKTIDITLEELTQYNNRQRGKH